jgi:hypothetical protein
MRNTRSFAFNFSLLTFLFLASVPLASAQSSTVGPGKLEVGVFPLGGTFFVGGDDNKEVDFNVYSFGANMSYYVSERAAIEGEFGVGLGLAQDVVFNNRDVSHGQMPHVWSYSANVVFFPGGTAGKHAPYYVTAGVGALSLQPRLLTKQFGYDVDATGLQTFMTENLGGGVKIFRDAAPEWGFRADYRYVIVNAKDDAPAFFAKTKSRGGHRVTFGVLYTWKK